MVKSQSELSAWLLPEAEPERALVPSAPTGSICFQRQVAQLIKWGQDPRDIQRVVHHVHRQWEVWLSRLDPRDLPRPWGWGIYPALPLAWEGPHADLVLLEAGQHPLFRERKFYIPPAHREHLMRLVEAGVDLPVLVLDELPAGTVRRHGLEAITSQPHFFLPPPAPSTLDLNERLGRRAAALNRALGLAGGAFVAAATALPLALAGLDPAVLGMIGSSPRPQAGDVVFVVVLSAWRW